MNIRDIARGKPPERRRVGIVFPDRIPVVSTAKRIRDEFGLECDCDDTSISLPVPRISALLYMGAFERLTGIPGFNEWDCKTRTDS